VARAAEDHGPKLAPVGQPRGPPGDPSRHRPPRQRLLDVEGDHAGSAARHSAGRGRSGMRDALGRFGLTPDPTTGAPALNAPQSSRAPRRLSGLDLQDSPAANASSAAARAGIRASIRRARGCAAARQARRRRPPLPRCPLVQQDAPQVAHPRPARVERHGLLQRPGRRRSPVSPGRPSGNQLRSRETARERGRTGDRLVGLYQAQEEVAVERENRAVGARGRGLV